MATADEDLSEIPEGQTSNPSITSAEFEAAHGESLSKVINLDTWMAGEDLIAAFDRLQQEVDEAVSQESEYQKKIRDVVFDKINSLPTPHNAGVYQATPQDIARVQKGLLFNGGVDACDGTVAVHDTIPLTITQIGVCLVSYNGEQGSWAHRLFRRDLRTRLSDPVDEVLTVLERRQKRSGQGLDKENRQDKLSELTRRGIMAYAERAILKDKSTAQWRMGHGNPAPYELLTGLWASQEERLSVALDLIDWYVQYKKFVFVPSAPSKKHLIMIGNALRPLEFAIVDTLQSEIEQYLTGHYRSTRKKMEEFSNEVAPKIVAGLYRVWDGSPPYLFYAHADYAMTAAHIAMADSMLQEHRGFPMLIDLAHTVCNTTFGVDTFTPSVQVAYTEAGQPFRYLGERETRY
jgi:hypothetical protein